MEYKATSLALPILHQNSCSLAIGLLIIYNRRYLSDKILTLTTIFFPVETVI